MRFLIKSCGFLLLSLVVASCDRHSSIGCPHDATLKTYKQWKESIRFPYIAPRARQEQIANNIEKVGVGSTKRDFVEALGEPDYEEELYPKEPDRPCIGYEFTYYFEKPEDIANEKLDKRVQAFFSPSGKATWIVSNVSGIREKGSPTTK